MDDRPSGVGQVVNNLFAVAMNPTVKEAVAATLMSGFVAQGKVVDQFEDALESWIGPNPVTVVAPSFFSKPRIKFGVEG